MTARASAGFTLTELLVTLALIALIASMLSGSLGIGRRAWLAGAHAEEVGTVEAARRFLTIRLASALPIRGSEGRSSSLRFSGSRSAVTFIAPAGRGEVGGLYRMSALSAEADGRAALVFEETAYGRAAPPHRRALIEGVAGVAFAYFGRPSPDAAPAWHSDWSGADLPRLVSVTVTFPDGDRRSFRPLLVEIPLDR